jgi:leucyl-tRNA synthetase
MAAARPPAIDQRHSLTSGRCGARRTTPSGASRGDIDVRQQMNTAISAMMELVNDLYAFTDGDDEPTPGAARVAREAIEALIVMLSPFAPHTAEELWERYGHQGTVARARGRSTTRSRAGPRRWCCRCRSTARCAAASPWRRTSPTRPSSRRSRWPTRPCSTYLQGKTVKKVVIAKGRLVAIVVT